MRIPNYHVDKPIPDQGSFPRDNSWDENKQRELEEFIEEYPEFYHILCYEAHKIGITLDNMFFDYLLAEVSGVEVQYHPEKNDRTLSAYWSHGAGGIVKFYYTSN
jgi:hypothetical protein